MLSAIKSGGKNHRSWQEISVPRFVVDSSDVEMKSLGRLDGSGICDIETAWAKADDYPPRDLKTKP